MPREPMHAIASRWQARYSRADYGLSELLDALDTHAYAWENNEALREAVTRARQIRAQAATAGREA